MTSGGDCVAVVLGTRPEIIKLAGVIRLLGDRALVIDTAQHYDDAMSGQFYREFGLAAPQVRLGVGGRSRGAQIGMAVERLDECFAEHRPAAVVVQGDTNSAMAGALAANAGGFLLAHVEAGLRSYDRAMPEEHNRVVADHLSDLCLAPTEVSRSHLVAEGIPDDRIVVTGNTVVEAVLGLLPARAERDDALRRHGVERGRFVLSTFHRPENVDEAGPLGAILAELGRLRVPVVLPLHPRTRARVAAFGLDHLLAPLRIVEPMGSRQFLGLAADSALLVSDSGGVQEESSVVKRPVVVVRRSTERPEVLGTFSVLVDPGPGIGAAAGAFLDDLTAVHARLEALPSPYGDGTASARSVEAIDAALRR